MRYLPTTTSLRTPAGLLAFAVLVGGAPLASGCASGVEFPASSGGALAAGGSAAGGGSSGGARASGGAATASGGATSGGAASSGGSSSGGAAGGSLVSAGGSVGGAQGNTGGANASGGSASGGSNSGGTGGTGGGGGAFQPCPAAEPCKILPLGDSITFGLGYDGGYRVNLFHLANEDGHDVTFTGTQTPNGPTMVDGKTFSRKHEGISGQTIKQIDDRIPKPGLTEMPHIILVHAGTNDMYQGPQGADMRLGALIDDLIKEAPDALVVVGNIIPFPQSASTVTTFNAAVPGMVKERADKGSHVLFVDQFKDFPTSELGDGVHPNKAGYDRMAAKWYEAIKSYLP